MGGTLEDRGWLLVNTAVHRLQTKGKMQTEGKMPIVRLDSGRNTIYT